MNAARTAGTGAPASSGTSEVGRTSEIGGGVRDACGTHATGDADPRAPEPPPVRAGRALSEGPVRLGGGARRRDGCGVDEARRMILRHPLPWAVRAEALKAADLPALRWTAALTAAASALMLIVLHGSGSEPTASNQAQQDPTAVAQAAGYGFDAVAWTWTTLVQIGFLVAGLLLTTGEHTSTAGRTTLLVVPRRGAVWAARLTVLALLAAAAAALLVATGLVTCPEATTRESVAAAGRTAVWLVAAAVMAGGAGAALRQTLGAATVVLVLVVVAPVAADLLGDAATWLPGPAARAWVREASWADGAVVLGWTATAMTAGGLRVVRTDA